ncbi:hypothetical protein Peur_072473 [Populus x canadensis]
MPERIELDRSTKGCCCQRRLGLSIIALCSSGWSISCCRCLVYWCSASRSCIQDIRSH